jgi:hypothetical protein
MTPLAGGYLLARPEDYVSVQSGWALFDGANLRWSTLEFPPGHDLEGMIHSDSRGRLHRVVPGAGSFDYGISSDGGATWISTTVDLPVGSSIENVDFKANGAIGVAAVAIHSRDGARQVDRDFVYKLDVTTDQPVLTRFFRVGLGDLNAGAGINADVRFDFETVALLPDGRVAVSFNDSKHLTPAVAIEQTTSLPPAA